MKQILFISLCVVAVSSVFSAEPNSNKNSQQKYTNKYDGFDVDAVLNNDRILKSYIKCLTGEGPCTKEGRELSQILPDAIRTECSKCDEKQKAMSTKVFKFLNEKYPALLEKLMKKFDPNGEHAKKFKEQILNAPAVSAAAPAATSTAAVPTASPASAPVSPAAAPSVAPVSPAATPSAAPAASVSAPSHPAKLTVKSDPKQPTRAPVVKKPITSSTEKSQTKAE